MPDTSERLVPGQEGEFTTASAVGLLCAMALGTGVFFLPSVFNAVGVLVASGLLVFFGVLSTALLVLVVEVAEQRQAKSWQDLCALVPLGKPLSALGLVLAPTIANCAHFELVAGMLFDLIEWFVTDQFGAFTFTAMHRLVLYIVFLLIAMPYTFREDMKELAGVGRLVAGVCVLTALLVVVSSCVHLAQHGLPAEGAVWGFAPDGWAPASGQGWADLFRAAPQVCFAFSSMFALWSVHESMRASDAGGARAKMRRASVVSGCIETGIYGIVALATVVAFGQQAGMMTKGNGAGNVLYNFPPDNYPVTVMCALLIVVIILDYPVIFYPVFNMSLKFFTPQQPLLRKYARHMYSLFFACVVLLINMCVTDLGDVFGLCGSLGISLYCYVVPGMIVCKTQAGCARFVGVLAVVVGLAMFTVSTFTILQHAFA